MLAVGRNGAEVVSGSIVEDMFHLMSDCEPFPYLCILAIGKDYPYVAGSASSAGGDVDRIVRSSTGIRANGNVLRGNTPSIPSKADRDRCSIDRD